MDMHDTYSYTIFVAMHAVMAVHRLYLHMQVLQLYKGNVNISVKIVNILVIYYDREVYINPLTRTEYSF